MRCRLVRISAPELGSTGGSSAVEQWTVKCASAAIHWSGVQISLPGFLAVTLSAEFPTGCQVGTVRLSYDHTTVKAPHPIRTAKLSTVGPDQYFGRGLQGNLGCCMSFFLFAHPETPTISRCPGGLCTWSALQASRTNQDFRIEFRYWTPNIW